MQPVAHSPLFLLLATAGCVAGCLLVYRLGRDFYRRMHHHPLAHPLVVGTLPLAALLLALDVPAASWEAGAQVFYALLGPSVVALAVPVYRQRRTLRRAALLVGSGVFAGGIIAPLLAILVVLPFALPTAVLLSLAPKSVTSAIAMAVAQSAGGYPELAVGVVIVTGIAGGIAAPLVFRLARVDDARVRGLVLGVVAHAVGTARALEMGQREGAFAGVGLALTGLATAVLLPVVIALLR